MTDLPGLADLSQDSLLPGYSGTFERVASAAHIRARARVLMAIAVIRTLWNPWTCPADQLPHLAWAWSVDIWKDRWPLDKKRAVVAAARDLHISKTTLQGIKDHVALTDAAVIDSIRPRDGAAAVDPFTAEEKAAIDADMPQIRIYPRARDFDVAAGDAFFDAAALDWRAGDGEDRAPLRYEERGVYVDRGVETPCWVYGLDAALGASYRIALASAGDVWRLFADWGAADWSAADDLEARDKIVTVAPDRSALDFAIAPGLIPIAVAPERVADLVPASPAMAFEFSALDLAALYPDMSADHVFDRLRLFDASRAGGPGRGFSFWGFSKFGAAPYTAELTIDIRVDVPACAGPLAADWSMIFDADMSPYHDALAAVAVSQAARDDVWINTITHEPITFGAAPALGLFKLGDWRPV
jgi:phage tail P2-like protein